MSIQVENISFIYNEGTPFESEALKDVSFTIEDNEFVGIIGHTGSGKSTLIQHLNGLLKPTSGRITINGIDITSTKNLKTSEEKLELFFNIRSINYLKRQYTKILHLDHLIWDFQTMK